MTRLSGLCCLLLMCSWYQLCNGNPKIFNYSYRRIWRGDPPKHIKDVTYGKLEEVFQGYFAYDLDLADQDYTAGLSFAAHKDCGDIKMARLRCSLDRCMAQHVNKRCYGTVRDCADITWPSHAEAARDIQICHSDVDSDRRYEWMREDQNEEKADYGVYNLDTCYTTQGMMTDWIWAKNDDICICNCESEDRKSDRYFSLQDVLSDENKVVTGAKLSLDNHVFHIQIQQGTLGANGTIIGKPKWKNIRTISKAQLLAHNISQNVDYWVHWNKNDLVYSVTYNQSYVYLDTLEHENPKRVVTGMRFQQVGDHLRFEIQTTPIDYATGKLDRAASSWTANKKTISQRREVKLAKPGNPAEIYNHSFTASIDRYVHFRMTDLVKDVGSWTVPFIDLQQVVLNRPKPLTGAGLIHRGEGGSGGFLALELLRYYDNPNRL